MLINYPSQHPGGGGGTLTWAIRRRASGQGMVFWPRCSKQGIQLASVLNRVSCPKQGKVFRAERRKPTLRAVSFFS